MPKSAGWAGDMEDLSLALVDLCAPGKLTYEQEEDDLPDVSWIVAKTPALQKLWETVPHGNAKWSTLRTAILNLMNTERYAGTPSNRSKRIDEASDQASIVRTICQHIRDKWYRRSDSKQMEEWMSPFPVPAHFPRKHSSHGNMANARNFKCRFPRKHSKCRYSPNATAEAPLLAEAAAEVPLLAAAAAHQQRPSASRSGAADPTPCGGGADRMIAAHREQWDECDIMGGLEHVATAVEQRAVGLGEQEVMEIGDDSDDCDMEIEDELDDQQVLTIYGFDTDAKGDRKAWRMMVDVDGIVPKESAHTDLPILSATTNPTPNNTLQHQAPPTTTHHHPPSPTTTHHHTTTPPPTSTYHHPHFSYSHSNLFCILRIFYHLQIHLLMGIVLFLQLVDSNYDQLLPKEYAHRVSDPVEGSGLMRGHWLEKEDSEDGEEGMEIDGMVYVAPVPVATPPKAKASAKAEAQSSTPQPAQRKRMRKKTKPAQRIEADAECIASSEEDNSSEEDKDDESEEALPKKKKKRRKISAEKKMEQLLACEEGEEDEEEEVVDMDGFQLEGDEEEEDEEAPKKKRRKKAKNKKKKEELLFEYDDEEEAEEVEEKEGLAEEGNDSEKDFEPDAKAKGKAKASGKSSKPVPPPKLYKCSTCSKMTTDKDGGSKCHSCIEKELDNEEKAKAVEVVEAAEGSKEAAEGSKEAADVAGVVAAFDASDIIAQEDGPIVDPYPDEPPGLRLAEAGGYGEGFKPGNLVTTTGLVNRGDLNGKGFKVLEVDNNAHVGRARVEELPCTTRRDEIWVKIGNLQALGLRESMAFFKCEVTIGDTEYKMRGTKQALRDPIMTVTYLDEDRKNKSLGSASCKKDSDPIELWHLLLKVMNALKVNFDCYEVLPTKHAFFATRDSLV